MSKEIVLELKTNSTNKQGEHFGIFRTKEVPVGDPLINQAKIELENTCNNCPLLDQCHPTIDPRTTINFTEHLYFAGDQDFSDICRDRIPRLDDDIVLEVNPNNVSIPNILVLGGPE